jgi:hypothetical protein
MRKQAGRRRETRAPLIGAMEQLRTVGYAGSIAAKQSDRFRHHCWFTPFARPPVRSAPVTQDIEFPACRLAATQPATPVWAGRLDRCGAHSENVVPHAKRPDLRR